MGLGIPVCLVWVGVSLHVLIDVWSCLVAGRITRNAGLVWILINPDIVESHLCRQRGGDTSQVDGREPRGHTKVHDHGHGLLRNDPLADVAIRSYGSGIKLPHGLVRDRPYNIAFGPRRVIETELGVFFPVVPVVVEIGQT